MAKIIRKVKMKFFADFHHGGAARGLFLTLKHRLGHDIYFPESTFAKYACEFFKKEGTWLGICPNTFAKNGGIPKNYLTSDESFPFVMTKEEFLDTDWDAIFITRTESQPIFKHLLQIHPKGSKIKRIGSMGNENTVFDWNWVPNLMVSDYLSFVMSPKNVNRLHYAQEMGTQFAEDNQEFVPITEDNLKTISTFINCLPTFNGPWFWDSEASCCHGKCPHCDGVPNLSTHGPISPFGIWTNLKNSMPNHKFYDYGIVCSQGVVPEKQLPEKYHQCALSWHFKTYDGYGFSLLQSIALGRLVIVPRRFHRYRTAGKYLINNLTCFEADWNPESIKEIIEYFTSDINRANKYSKACFDASKTLFNWDLEAFRVQEFLQKLK